MTPISRFSLAVWISGALALSVTAARADVVMDWNAKADALAVEKQLPNAPNARGQAMLHIAMFEAINAIGRRPKTR